jgi:hypothetical protein
MIRHSVFFRLKHAAGSAAEQGFFRASMVLATLPTVKTFETLKQVSPKNGFSHGFSMEFDDQASYEAYNVHRLHVAYVQDVWLPQVAEFMEIDTVPL